MSNKKKFFTAVKKDRSSALMFHNSMPFIPPTLITGELDVMKSIILKIGIPESLFDFIPLPDFGKVTGICELNYHVKEIDSLEQFEELYGRKK